MTIIDPRNSPSPGFLHPLRVEKGTGEEEKDVLSGWRCLEHDRTLAPVLLGDLRRVTSLCPFHCAPVLCSPFLRLPFPPTVLLPTLFSEETQAACCCYGD
jgi:hypothetical protein